MLHTLMKPLDDVVVKQITACACFNGQTKT